MHKLSSFSFPRGLLAVSLGCAVSVFSGCGGASSDPAAANGVSPRIARLAAAYPSDVAQAMATGDSSAVTIDSLKGPTRDLLNNALNQYGTIKQTLFQNVAPIDWNPSHDSVWLTVKDLSRNFVMLSSNYRYSDGKAGRNQPLAVAGYAPGSQAPYMVIGGNPLGVPGNVAMDSFMRNTVGWLSARSTSGNFKVVEAHMPGQESYWFPYEKKVRDWFYSSYPGASVNGVAANAPQVDDVCDGDALAGCLQDADLLVLSRSEGSKTYDPATVVEAVRQAQARGIPVLYMHYYRDLNTLSSGFMKLFGLDVNNNYWDQEGLLAFDPATLPAQPPQLASALALLNHLIAGDFSTTWSGCTTSGRIDCSKDSAYMAEFGVPAGRLRTTLRNLDAGGTALFGQPGFDLEKLMVLIGDRYRVNVSYPMSKTSTSDFLRAYFSDMTAYITRGMSSVAQNLGNFSAVIPVSTPSATQSVSTAVPSSGSKEYLTGLYVIPGKAVTLTRNDGGSGAVRFGLNILRDNTWVFNTYDRPTLISSPRIALVSGKPVTITSPYGGPLMLFIDAASGAPDITIQVDGAITHPVLRDPTNAAQVANFQAEVGATPTNWVGFATDTLALHSTLGHFKQSMASYNNDMARLAADTWTYTVKDTYELAGFNAASGKLQLAPGVQAVCTARGWDCSGLPHRRDTVQDVISDVHALCGDGCSGNPYDQDWYFQPLGWGESHEIGHNIQPNRLRIYAGQSAEVSNNIFPMHKQMKYNLSPAGAASPIVARANTGAAVFNTLEAAQGSADPATAMYNSSWSDTSYAANNSVRVMFYRQLAEYARYYNPQFSTDWEVFTLLYLLDRNFTAHASDWPSVAGSYGFGNYTSYPSAMSGNDFMLIASSNLIGRDMGPMFCLWGITTSDAAKAQVAAYALPAAQALYFPMNDLAAPPARVGAPILMNASAVYPAGY